MNYSIFTFSGSQHGESGEYCKTEFDFSSSCKHCGTGALIDEPLRVKRIKKSKDFFETLNGDYIISGKLYNLIKSELPSFFLAQIESTKGEKLDFYHLYSRTVLPPITKESDGYTREGGCDFCNRNGYYNDVKVASPEHNYKTYIKPLNFIYSKEDLENFYESDILLTWECYGLSNLIEEGNKVVRYARSWIVISDRLRNILQQHIKRNLIFEPITIK